MCIAQPASHPASSPKEGDKRTFAPPERGLKGIRLEQNAPIRIPGDSEPYDPLVGKDRPKEVQDEKEASPRPRDEAVEFRRATARLGRGQWRELSQGRRRRRGLVFVFVFVFVGGSTRTTRRLAITGGGHYNNREMKRIEYDSRPPPGLHLQGRPE